MRLHLEKHVNWFAVRFNRQTASFTKTVALCLVMYLALTIGASLQGQQQKSNVESGEDTNNSATPSLIQQAEQSSWAPDVGSLQQTNSNGSYNSIDDSELDWLNDVKVGYDGGFVIASDSQQQLEADDDRFRMRINGWGQLRHSYFDSFGATLSTNQIQLKRARLIFSGSAFTQDFSYFFQFDGRSSSGDDFRLLDYQLDYDVGRHRFGFEEGTLGFRTGKYKMPFHMARYISGREFEFSDRSVASTYFDVNRSLGWGLYGKTTRTRKPINWEFAVFNGLVTGGAETGSSGSLDANFAYSARVFWYPTGEWGEGELSDFDGHCQLATRVGVAFANSTIDRRGNTEFNSIRTVDSGSTLASILPFTTTAYTVNLSSIDASMKYYGWSMTLEYYFRLIDDFQGTPVPELFDHGHWLQVSKFVVPRKLQLMARWSRVSGNSGTLGASDLSSDEISGGFAWYVRGQHARFTFDATWLDGAPIDSSSLGIQPGDNGVLLRSQIQFAF